LAQGQRIIIHLAANLKRSLQLRPLRFGGIQSVLERFTHTSPCIIVCHARANLSTMNFDRERLILQRNVAFDGISQKQKDMVSFSISQ
jgi:hypothetical protein